MNCEEVRNLISDWIDGELDVELTAKLEEHLFGCAQCRRYSQALSVDVDALFKKVNPVAVPSDLWDGIKSEIEAEQKIVRLPLRRKTARIWLLAGAAAAMFMAFVLSDFGTGNKGAVSGPAQVVSIQSTDLYVSLSAFDTHETDSYEFGTAVETLLL